MNWSDLHYFLAVARCGSLARAARELGVEHTTVSRRLGALEADLGVRLFARGPAGLTLTTAGEEMLPCVEAIAAQVEGIARRLSGADAKVAGTVRLTIPEAGNGYFLRNLAALRQRHPELVIEVLSANRALDLRRGEADLAVRFVDFADQDLIVKKAGLAGWSLYASREYVARKGPLVSLERLDEHDLLGYDPSLAGVAGPRWLREHAKPERVVMRGNSIAGVLSAALAGMGIAALPCFATQETGLVRMTDAVIGGREILLVVHPDLHKTARIRAVMDFLLELFARDAAQWSGAVEGV